MIFASASPGSQAADLADTEPLVRRRNEAGLVSSARDALMAHAHEVLGHALHFGNNRMLHSQGRDEYEAAVVLYRTARDWPNLAQSLDALGRVRSQLGDHTGADDAFAERIALQQQVKDLWGVGASLNGRASSLLRRGRPLDALPVYEANLALLGQTRGASPELILQNLGQKVTACLAAYQNPFVEPAPRRADEDLLRAAAVLADYAARMEGQPGMKVSKAYHLMLRGALARLEARLLNDRTRRLALLTEGEAWVSKSIEEFREAGVLPPLPNAHLHLAGLLTDHARSLDDHGAQDAVLRKACKELHAAEDLLWDSYERAYLELEWAWYYRTTGPASSAENHLTSARLHALACGNRSIETDVGTALGTHLRGPAGGDRWDVVLPPGTRLEMAVLALDWRGRPIPDYDLRAALIGAGAADSPRVTLTPSAARTDALGKVSFTVAVPADARPGTVEFEVRDHGVFREARAHIHVRPFDVRMDSALDSRPPLAEEDLIVLRNLFGPRFREVFLRREFGSGLSGARVFLVEPLLVAPHLADGGPGGGAGLRGQPCLVKIGSRRQINHEIEQHTRSTSRTFSPPMSPESPVRPSGESVAPVITHWA